MFAISHNAIEMKEVEQFMKQEMIKETKPAYDRDKLCSSCFSVCGDEEVDNSETLRDIRRLRLEQESGVDWDYRCVKCRQCNDCRDADRTEAISLREEAEMVKIEESVHLDLDKRRITCTLPLRGEEREYLVTNYSQALKVLEQQCKVYNNQKETKDLIIMAFNKLFDNGHAALLQDLSED